MLVVAHVPDERPLPKRTSESLNAVSAPSVLIRLDNLRSGGGLQVAQSVLTELAGIVDEDVARAYPWLESDIRILVSEEVADSCLPAVLDRLRPEIVPRSSRLRALIGTKPADVVFTLFGPTYDRVQARRFIAGFADVTSLYPDVAQSGRGRLPQHAKLRLRTALSRAHYRKADKVIVEAPHLAEDLASRWGLDPARISIVPNVLNGVFGSSDPVAARHPGTPPTFCYVTRAYPHKNLNLLGCVAKILKAEFGMEVRFLLTLTEDEWSGLDAAVRASAINVGPVAVGDLPAVYAQADGCVFPSLLEGFSATPLEALATGTPLIASDRRFCTDVLGDCAIFADPTDPKAWAEAIKALLSDSGATAARVRRGRLLIANWPTPRARVMAYLDHIDAELRGVR